MVKLVAIGDVGQAQHLLGCEAVIDQVVQEEVLEVVRADGVLALLGDLAVARRGQQLGADRRVEHVEQGLSEHFVLRRLGDVAHDHLHHRLRRADVYVVHGDVVAVIGAPAVRELGQVLRADVDAAVELVGNVHENLRALTRLRVFIDDVAVFGIVADVLEMEHHALADVDDAHRRAKLLGHHDGVGLCAVGRAEARHGDGRDILRRQPQQLHRLGADDDGKRGVHPAGNADDRIFQPGVLHAPRQARGLHMQQPLCRRVVVLLVRGAEGILGIAARERRLAALHPPADDDMAVMLSGKRRVTPPRCGKRLNVQLRDRDGDAVLRRGEDRAVFRHDAQARIDRVGARFAGTGRGHLYIPYSVLGAIKEYREDGFHTFT